MLEPRRGQFLSCQRWFNISLPSFQSTTSVHNDVQPNVNTMLCDHLNPLPPSFSSLKIPILMGSISGFLLHQAMNCTLCYGGWRADVNTAFNYKSNPKRATLCCPRAFRTKAQPSYPNSPHRTAGNFWTTIHQDKFTTETETFSVTVCQSYAENVMLIFYTVLGIMPSIILYY